MEDVIRDSESCRLCDDTVYEHSSNLSKKYNDEEISFHFYDAEHSMGWRRTIEKEKLTQLLQGISLQQKSSPNCPLCAVNCGMVNAAIFFKSWNADNVNGEFREIGVEVKVAEDDVKIHKRRHLIARPVESITQIQAARNVMKDMRRLSKVNGLEDIDIITARINTSLVQLAQLEMDNGTWSEEYANRVDELQRWLKMKQEIEAEETQQELPKNVITIEAIRCVINDTLPIAHEGQAERTEGVVARVIRSVNNTSDKPSVPAHADFGLAENNTPCSKGSNGSPKQKANDFATCEDEGDDE